ncbi:DNA topoisomerase III, partial [Photobacterium damselae subsp. damselae]|nr:DNA topoisomerase III [Photobacterium damselae subsp. damselae]
LIPRKAAKQQLAVIKKLAKSATEIVHAGDPDRVLLRSFYGIHLLQ